MSSTRLGFRTVVTVMPSLLGAEAWAASGSSRAGQIFPRPGDDFHRASIPITAICLVKFPVNPTKPIYKSEYSSKKATP